MMKYKRQILKKWCFFSIGTTSTKFKKKSESVPLQQNFKKIWIGTTSTKFQKKSKSVPLQQNFKKI